MALGEKDIQNISVSWFYSNYNSHKSNFLKAIGGNDDIGEIFENIVDFQKSDRVTDTDYKKIYSFIRSENFIKEFGEKYYKDFLVAFTVVYFRGKTFHLLGGEKKGRIVENELHFSENFFPGEESSEFTHDGTFIKLPDSKKNVSVGKKKYTRQKNIDWSDYSGEQEIDRMKRSHKANIGNKKEYFLYYEIIQKLGNYIIGINLKTGLKEIYDRKRGIKVPNHGKKKSEYIDYGNYVFLGGRYVFPDNIFQMKEGIEKGEVENVKYFVDITRKRVIRYNSETKKSTEKIFGEIVQQYGDYLLVETGKGGFRESRGKAEGEAGENYYFYNLLTGKQYGETFNALSIDGKGVEFFVNGDKKIMTTIGEVQNNNI